MLSVTSFNPKCKSFRHRCEVDRKASTTHRTARGVRLTHPEPVFPTFLFSHCPIPKDAPNLNPKTQVDQKASTKYTLQTEQTEYNTCHPSGQSITVRTRDSAPKSAATGRCWARRQRKSETTSMSFMR